MCPTYVLVIRAHGSPAALTLLLNSTLGSVLAKVTGNDRTSRLHVEEVRSQGALGCVWVVLTLLALLLLLGSRNGLSGRRRKAQRRTIESSEGVQAGNVLQGGRLANKQVALAEVVSCEISEQLLNSGETRVNLGWIVS